MTDRIPYSANIPGDFYVEAGCCTMCEVPFSEAPELFGVALDRKGYPHCYVKRQPVMAAEFDRMISAIRHAELGCIRYRGLDSRIRLRLAEIGEQGVCDEPPADAE